MILLISLGLSKIVIATQMSVSVSFEIDYEVKNRWIRSPRFQVGFSLTLYFFVLTLRGIKDVLILLNLQEFSSSKHWYVSLVFIYLDKSQCRHLNSQKQPILCFSITFEWHKYSTSKRIWKICLFWDPLLAKDPYNLGFQHSHNLDSISYFIEEIHIICHMT